MDMEVNKTHLSASIEDSGEKPLFPKLAKLIGAGAAASRIYPKEKRHCFFVPPLRRFSPTVENLQHSIETLSPYESSYSRILVAMDFDRFINELRHGAILEGE